MAAPTNCAAATSLFEVTCMDNLVIQLKPVVAQDNQNCFTNAYAGLSLTDLKISPEGETGGETVCTAAEQTKTWYGGQSPPVATDTFFWGASDLETPVGTSGIWFSASSCGISPGVQTVQTGGTPKQYMQFSTTIMSTFDDTPNTVLTQQEMLETAVVCNYELTVDGIAVAIDTELDAVEDENKIDQDEDTNDIDAAQVGKTIKVNNAAYVASSDVTLGSGVEITFDSIGELTTGFYIDSCVADNELTFGATGYKSLALITNSCAASTSGDATMTSINPVTDGTVFSFNQFAFVDSSSTFDTPVLSFELNCVLKFGTKPSCGTGRKRRAGEDSGTEVSVSFSVTPEGDYKVSDGVVTNVEGAPKSTDSGANEMMVSALAASALLLL